MDEIGDWVWWEEDEGEGGDAHEWDNREGSLEKKRREKKKLKRALIYSKIKIFF